MAKVRGYSAYSSYFLKKIKENDSVCIQYLINLQLSPFEKKNCKNHTSLEISLTLVARVCLKIPLFSKLQYFSDFRTTMCRFYCYRDILRGAGR